MIENIAARQLGVQLSESHLNYELLRMFNPRTKKGLLKPLNNPALFQRVEEVLDASGLFSRMPVMTWALRGTARLSAFYSRNGRRTCFPCLWPNWSGS